MKSGTGMLGRFTTRLASAPSVVPAAEPAPAMEMAIAAAVAEPSPEPAVVANRL